MTYKETLHYLYTKTPVYQHCGSSAYKPGLNTSIRLDDRLENPHKAYTTIHVAGTNGKGSVCHLLAAILQQSGYRVGLYTSPHILDFRERIRVNGQMIAESYVVDFVETHRSFFEPLHPSFFELTSTMAFDYFRSEKVDIALIETGLGGRLDSTNIITPLLSVITNISKDHTNLLGNTLQEIAFEKAGIMKEQVPVVIGEVDQTDVLSVFLSRADEANALCYIATEEPVLNNSSLLESGEWQYESADYGVFTGELMGAAQLKNTQTVLCALRVLQSLGVDIPQQAVAEGFLHVTEITGLQGRLQQISNKPYVLCDTGHNVGAWTYLTPYIQSKAKEHARLFMIVGFSMDKEVETILHLMPQKAHYLFTQASVDRALPAAELAGKAQSCGLKGEVYATVAEAIAYVKQQATDADMVFIGGSFFVVSDALPLFEIVV